MPIGFGAPHRTVRRAHSTMALAGVLLLWPAHRVQAQDGVTKRPLGQDLSVYLPPPGEVSPRPSPEMRNPTGPLGLRDALALALLQNPTLASFAWETRAREARILQAGRPPNPSVSVLLEDIGATQFASGGINEPIQPQTTIQLSQLVELGGKRGARQRLATASRDVASWDYEAARIDVFTDVARAFADVLAGQENVAQVERTSQLVEDVHRSVGLRVTAGVVSPIEETRAAVTAGLVRADLARARRALDASRVRLAVLWGSSTAAFTAVEGDLQATPASLPSLLDLTAKVQQNPDLARWAAEIVQRQAALSVERSRAVPDVSLTAGYRRFTDIDANAVVVGATISLPIFDRNQAGVQEAQLRLAKGHEERRSAELRVVAALSDAYAVVAGALDEITTLRSAVLPGSQQAFEAVSEGYRLGRFSYLDVLEAQRTLIASRVQLHRALSDFHKATATVERLIGAPLIAGASSAAGRE